MLYQSYQQKLDHLTAIFAKIWHFRILIVCAVVFVVALIGVLLGITGTIVSFRCDSSVWYGDELQVSASAIFKGVTYEYRQAGGTWGSERPTKVGNYEVRASADGIGGTRYSQVLSFSVLPRPTEVTIVQETLVYGETPVATAELVYSDEILSQSVAYEIEDANFMISSAELTVVNEAGEEVTENYQFNFQPCSVAMAPRPITISVEDAVKVYDGTPLTSREYCIADGSLVEGDRLEVDFFASVTLASTVENTPVVHILDRAGTDITAYYDITIDVGMLVVEPMEIMLTTGSAQSVYDGADWSEESYTASVPLPAGHTAVCSAFPSVRNVGTYENTATVVIVNAEGEDVSGSFRLQMTFGTLTVLPRTLEVTTGSQTWAYDGLPHSCKEFSAVGLVEGHAMQVMSATSVTDVTDDGDIPGYVENILTFSIMDAQNTDVSANYSLQIDYGSLRISEAVIVRVFGLEKYYDGTPLSYTEDDYRVIHHPEGYDVRVMINGSLTEPGKRTPQVTVQVFDEGGRDVTAQQMISVIGECYLRVLPREIIVSSISVSVENQGENLYGNAFDNAVWISLGSLADGHRMEAEVTGVLHPEESSAENTIGLVTIYDENGRDVTNCYNIVLNFGTLQWT